MTSTLIQAQRYERFLTLLAKAMRHAGLPEWRKVDDKARRFRKDLNEILRYYRKAPPNSRDRAAAISITIEEYQDA